MTDRSIRWAIMLHPRKWQNRYGDEVSDLSQELREAEGQSSLRIVFGLLVSATREWARVARLRRRRVALCTAIVLVLVVGTVGGLDLSTGQRTEHGPSVGGPISFAHGKVKAPDFIAVIGKGKVAGYVASSYLFPLTPNDPHAGEVAPVYARNLHTLVGHEYPGVGFVPLGVSWTSLPCTTEEITAAPANGEVLTTSIACPSTIETVPNVVGMVTPTAMGMLSGKSLTPDITYVRSDSVAAGHIVSITPSPGTKVHARSIITVVSSLGSNGRSSQTAIRAPSPSKPG
jgi:hypothetical protein